MKLKSLPRKEPPFDVVCPNCGCEFDWQMYYGECPDCNNTVSETGKLVIERDHRDD